MQALRKVAAEPGLELRDAGEVRAPNSDEVLVRVSSAGICGTDLHIDHWTPSYHFLAPALPVTVGHEFSGVVAGLGSAVGTAYPALGVGTLVAVRPSVTCGVCAACLAQDPDACTKRRGIGVMRDGGFAQYAVVPARNCVVAPGGLDGEVAALTEPLTVSWESVRVAGVRLGDRVLVLGPGNIGQGIALFARDAGAAQVVVGGQNDPDRFAVLRAMGFSDLIDFAGTTMEAGLAPYLAQGKFDVVIEATGAGAVIAPALAALKVHGTLVITGIHAKPVPVDLTALVRNHQTIRGSYRAPEAAWPQVLAFARKHQDVVRHMITHRVPLAQAMEGLALAHDRVATKVMIQP
jgi:threonine 3-dehydrogenase